MNLITPDTGLLFWMVLIFGIVFFILAKWGFPAITGMVDKRNEHISESLRLADEARERMSKLAEEQEALLAQTRQEQGRLMKEAAQARAELLSQAKEDARQQAADMIEKARLQIDAEREAAMRDVRRQVALISVEVAEKVLRARLDSNGEQQALLDRLVDESTAGSRKDVSSVIPSGAKESSKS